MAKQHNSLLFNKAWAPMMDRYTPPFLGRRRGWLLVSQVLLIGLIASMALWNLVSICGD